MNMKGTEFLLLVIMAAAVMTPALGQDVAPPAGAASAGARSNASILDFSGTADRALRRRRSGASRPDRGQLMRRMGIEAL